MEKELNLEELEKVSAGSTRKVTEQNVLEGMKFIAENSNLDFMEMQQGLYECGCFFTVDDINRELQTNYSIVREGLLHGDLKSGANLIANMRDNEYSFDKGMDMFVMVDEPGSVYGYVRAVTGDEAFTKESIQSKGKEK